MLYDLREKDESLYDYNNFEKIWMAKKKKKANPLIKSLFHSFKGNFIQEILKFKKKKKGYFGYCCFLAFFVSMLMFSTPIMINVLISYVKNADRTWQEGLKLLLIILALKIVSAFFTTHQTFAFVIILIFLLAKFIY